MDVEAIVVVGASAGGVEATSTLLRNLPGDFAPPVFIVIHTAPEAPSLLPSIFGRVSGREARQPVHGERVREGVIYVAAPDHHMVLESDGTISVSRGPRENRHRPAIDPLFRSAATIGGPNVVAVILSGTLDDGTAGIIAVKRRGGVVIVQDPEDALYAGMPRNAIEHAEVDHIAPAAAIARLIVQTVGEQRDTRTASAELVGQLQMENRIATMDAETMNEDNRPGTPSIFSCPECGGVLRQINDGEFVRYRCRVGHGYSPEAMLGAQSDRFEEAMWMALRTLEESAALANRLAVAERNRGHDWMAMRFDDRERNARERAEAIRRVLDRGANQPPVDVPHDQHTH